MLLILNNSNTKAFELSMFIGSYKTIFYNMTYVTTYLQAKLGNANHAVWLLTANAYELTQFCHEHDICEPALFKSLFYDNFPDLVNLIVINDNVKKMICDYRPDSVNKHGVETYWEMLYLELISLDEHARRELEQLINEPQTEAEELDQLIRKQTTPELSSSLLSYPITVVVLSQTVRGMQRLIFKHDFVEYATYNEVLLTVFKITFLASHNKIRMLRLYLERSNYTQQELDVALNASAPRGRVEVVKLLLENGADPTFENNNTLIRTVKRGHSKVLSLLLKDKRVDPSVNNSKVLQMSKSAANLILLLKDGRVDPTVDDNNILLHAATRGYVEVVRLLLADPRVDPMVGKYLWFQNMGAFHAAVGCGKVEVVKLFLKDGRVTPPQEKNYFTSHRGIIKLLREYECEYNLRMKLQK